MKNIDIQRAGKFSLIGNHGTHKSFFPLRDDGTPNLRFCGVDLCIKTVVGRQAHAVVMCSLGQLIICRLVPLEMGGSWVSADQ